MKIFVTGATGFIGKHIVAALLAVGHQVTICGRNLGALEHPISGVKVLEGDFAHDHQARDWAPRVKGFDAVINCVGIIRQTRSQRFDALHRAAPIALFEACVQAGVSKVIQLSALGADDTAVSDYHLTKKAADDALAAMRIKWVILQPSIVYGAGAKSSAFFRALAALPVIPLVADGQQPVQPVHVDDLVAVVTKALATPELDHRKLAIVGPAPITMKSLLASLRQWLGWPPARYVAIPYPIAFFCARILGYLGNAPLNEGIIRMLKQGNTGNVTAMRDVLGHEPISFKASINQIPSQQADRWHARLYFLLPLLRISLGLLWIVTGVVSAFLFPTNASYTLLATLGIEGAWAPLALYGAAALDLSLGIALLMNFRVILTGAIQIIVIITYSMLITLGLSEYWLHPFGAMTKNIPLIIATLIVMATQERA